MNYSYRSRLGSKVRKTRCLGEIENFRRICDCRFRRCRNNNWLGNLGLFLRLILDLLHPSYRSSDHCGFRLRPFRIHSTNFVPPLPNDLRIQTDAIRSTWFHGYNLSVLQHVPKGTHFNLAQTPSIVSHLVSDRHRDDRIGQRIHLVRPTQVLLSALFQTSNALSQSKLPLDVAQLLPLSVQDLLLLGQRLI